jgi:26 proteasome complex subunit DSS1
MAAEPKAATEEAKIDLFEDDDEFEEFEINEGNKKKKIFLFVEKSNVI